MTPVRRNTLLLALTAAGLALLPAAWIVGSTAIPEPATA
jgi:hypothetical protein